MGYGPWVSKELDMTKQLTNTFTFILIVHQQGNSKINSSILGYVCSCAQLCLTLCTRTDCSPPGCYVHGVFQARIPE